MHIYYLQTYIFLSQLRVSRISEKYQLYMMCMCVHNLLKMNKKQYKCTSKLQFTIIIHHFIMKLFMEGVTGFIIH